MQACYRRGGPGTMKTFVIIFVTADSKYYLIFLDFNI